MEWEKQAKHEVKLYFYVNEPFLVYTFMDHPRSLFRLFLCFQIDIKLLKQIYKNVRPVGMWSWALYHNLHNMSPLP